MHLLTKIPINKKESFRKTHKIFSPERFHLKTKRRFQALKKSKQFILISWRQPNQKIEKKSSTFEKQISRCLQSNMKKKQKKNDGMSTLGVFVETNWEVKSSQLQPFCSLDYLENRHSDTRRLTTCRCKWRAPINRRHRNWKAFKTPKNGLLVKNRAKILKTKKAWLTSFIASKSNLAKETMKQKNLLNDMKLDFFSLLQKL